MKFILLGSFKFISTCVSSLIVWVTNMDCICNLCFCSFVFFTIYFTHKLLLCRLTEMEILYKKEKEEADQLLEQQRLVSSHQLAFIQTHCVSFLDVLSSLEVVDMLVITAQN